MAAPWIFNAIWRSVKTLELTCSFLTEDSHGTIVCLLPPVFLPPNFDWVFSTVVTSSKSLKRATPRGRIWDSQWMDASVPFSPLPLPLASFFAFSPIFARPKLVRSPILGFLFAKNAQERLLRRLGERSYMKRLGMLIVSGTNQGFWSHLGRLMIKSHHF